MAESGPTGESYDEVGIDDPLVSALLLAYQAELARDYGAAFNPGSGAVAAEEFRPPLGHYYLVRQAGVPVACGGVRMRQADVAEIKRMYVVPAARGGGLGRRLLAHLEQSGAALGATRIRLDTGARMTPAVTLYRTSGYLEIEDYNGNPDAGWWFEKLLTA